MAHLELALLGPFEAALDGQPAGGLNSPYLRALLAYLAVESGREHRRETLAALLWPERSDQAALSALRHALSNLRGALAERSSADKHEAPSSHLLITRRALRFNRASDHWLDVAEFELLRNRSDVPSLERAAELYRGPFLQGLSLRDSPAFEEWLLLTGEAFQRRVLSLLDRLTSLQMERGDWAQAARWARRQLELDPYRDRAHRQLMRALALTGERSAALTHYAACRRLLAEELGCEPDDETQALHAQIRDGRLVRSEARPQPSPGPRSLPVPPPRIGPALPPPPLVARERELARLNTLLERALTGHRGGVALIAGEAGSGKTALLDEFARRASQAHSDLISLRGTCNANGEAGDPYLPFREALGTLAGDVESKRAGGTLSAEQARRVWEALPAVAAALAERGPDLIDTFVPGEPLLQRVEGFAGPPDGRRWQARLRALVIRAQEGAAPAHQPDLFAQATDVLHAVAVERPLLLTIDDLQWADAGTAALLFHLGRRLAGSRILLACAYRGEGLPERQASGDLGDPRSPASVLRELLRQWGDILVDLDQANGRAFIEAYVDSEPNQLGTAFREALYAHTGGNPLFTVELLRGFERAGTLVQDEAGRWIEATAPDWASWPPQVEAVIAGHMAGLSDDDRSLLQVASVQGERFTAEVAARVLGWDEETTVRRLSGPLRARHRLVEALTLDRLPFSEQRLSRYRFRHSLVQRSAYRTLDPVLRPRLHEGTARALAAIYASEDERSPKGASSQATLLAPELARHYEAADMPLEAARQHLLAGRWAARLAAHDETLAHLQRGLAALEEVSASHERLDLEWGLCLGIIKPAMLQHGWQAPVYREAVARLSDLTRHHHVRQDPQRIVTALNVLTRFASWSADPEHGRQLGEQLLKLVRDDPRGARESRTVAHWALGESHWALGQLVAARDHLERAVALHDPAAGPPPDIPSGFNADVKARVVLGYTRWLLGYPEQASDTLHEALALVGDVEQPLSMAFAYLVAGVVFSVLGRDAALALRHAAVLRSLSEGGPLCTIWADLLEAHALTESIGRDRDGQTRERPTAATGPTPDLKQALVRAREAGLALERLGSGMGQSSQLLVQAQILLQVGRPTLALEVMDRALAWVERTGVRVMEAEVRRVRGELLLRAGGAPHLGAPAHLCSLAQAEASFHRALEIAREQQARWLELRTAVSLARLWQSLGRRDEARPLLSGIYGWFTEGFATLDLVAAQALLEELA